MFRKLIGWMAKPFIFRRAVKQGYDIDGDVIFFLGHPFYFNILRNVCELEPMNEELKAWDKLRSASNNR